VALVAEYAIVLTAGAREAIREMSPAEKQHVAQALREELLDSAGVRKPYIEIRSCAPENYPARLLTSGHIAIFRLLTEAELRAFARQRDAPVPQRGVVVHDILCNDNAPRTRADLMSAFTSLV
jgi:hypothetical protein